MMRWGGVWYPCILSHRPHPPPLAHPYRHGHGVDEAVVLVLGWWTGCCMASPFSSFTPQNAVATALG